MSDVLETQSLRFRVAMIQALRQSGRVMHLPWISLYPAGLCTLATVTGQKIHTYHVLVDGSLYSFSFEHDRRGHPTFALLDWRHMLGDPDALHIHPIKPTTRTSQDIVYCGAMQWTAMNTTSWQSGSWEDILKDVNNRYKKYLQSQTSETVPLCESILVDHNPQVGATRYDRESYQELERINTGDKEEDGWFWGCPVCQTDEYLSDDVDMHPEFELIFDSQNL